MTTFPHPPFRLPSARRAAAAFLAALGLLAAPALQAQDTVCARVKLEIKQELTLERQGFDAEMRINNTTDTSTIEDVAITVSVTDENGTPVAVTDDPNNLNAKFFLRLAGKKDILAIDGTGKVAPKSTAVINWLLIPAPGAAGASALGKKFLVGATLKYKYGGEQMVLQVVPDVITVKPLPLLTLDYFLTRDVLADDPLTPEIEPVVPFTLGVRVRNNGVAAAKQLKIDSAQPKIVENLQGLLINFQLTGSYVNDLPAQNSLLIDFGDVAAQSSKMGRWNMETTLAGKFTEFTARFSHADELGGALTSILQATNAHFLLRDVRVDLPGRDFVRDFLAQDGDVIRVYESDGPDSEVTDRSGVATLSAGPAAPDGSATYRLAFPPTAGFAYVRLPDPFNGSKALGKIVRSDAKEMAPENVWLSQTRNEQTKKWEYWVNVFDVNTTGEYDSAFQAPPVQDLPPVLQFIPDREVEEGKQLSFIVEASSAAGLPLTLSAAPLPAGATLVQQAADPQAPKLARAVFNWVPAKGTAGNYPIVFTVSDGARSASRTAAIKVKAAALPAGPATPVVVAPLSGAIVRTLKPALSVQTALDAQDKTSKVQFELYADEAGTALVASALLDKAATTLDGNGVPLPAPTVWQLEASLAYRTTYWWRARAWDGTLYSPWSQARLVVSVGQDGPEAFNLTSPAPGALVDSLSPRLAWTNSRDTGEPLSYSATVYKDAALTEVAAQVANVAGDPSGTTSVQLAAPLPAQAAPYYWRVVATDRYGAVKTAGARAFTVDTAVPAPAAPLPAAPAAGAVTGASATLSAANSAGAEGRALSYVFELDTAATFDSADKRSSGALAQGSGGSTGWSVADLAENRRYWWRVKARDGLLESGWSVSSFLASAANDAPPAPRVRNPGNGAWSALRQPSLEAYPVQDPEGQAVRYQFELYADAALAHKLGEGTSTHPGLIAPVELASGSWYWWRVRALDADGAASAWSAAASLYSGSGTPQAPAVELVAPAQPVAVAAGARQVTLRWDGADPSSEPSVALYYSSSRDGAGGNLIVQGLRQAAGSRSGSHVWDTSALAPGVYYVYAVIHDASGSTQTYAPGPVVVPNPAPAGTLKAAAPALVYEAGSGTYAITWNGAAPQGSAMVLPINYALPLWVTTGAGQASGSRLIGVHYPLQCSKQPVLAPFQTGPLISDDLNFAGRVAAAGNAPRLVPAAASNTGDDTLRVCELRILSERKLADGATEYAVSVRLSNLGAALSGALVQPSTLPSGVTASGQLQFGPIGAGETGSTQNIVTIRSPAGTFTLSSQSGIKWTVQATR